MPKISVVIPTHNREKMCKRAIASVVGQTFLDYEIIVSNDSENDYDTKNSYIFEHPRVTYYKKDPEGYDKNYMFLAEKATGDYLYCLEDDDYLVDQNIFEKCVNLIDKYPTVNAVLMSSALDFKEAVSPKTSFKEIYSNEEFFEVFPDISVDFQFGQVLARTELIKPLILEEVPKRYGSVNTDAFIFLLLCLYKGDLCHVNSTGYMITRNGDNQSWDNYLNCFFGGNSFIQDVYQRASHLNVDLEMWRDKMEYNHIRHLLNYLPNYLNEVESVEHC